MKKSTFFVAVIILLTISCMKNDDFHCDLQNIGTANINVKGTTQLYSVVIVYPDGKERKKEIDAGKTSDTINLSPGVYQLNIHGLNHNRETVKTETHQINIQECDETDLSLNY